MKTPLMPIEIRSSYKDKNGNEVLLPKRMAICTPDTFDAVFAIRDALRENCGDLVLSDMYRSFDMQLQAHNDFVTGRKSANSPAPGGSVHEAGRAFDLELSRIKIKLADFWAIAKEHGVFPIIDKPDDSKDEAWHFDRRGSHQIVYDYYKAGKGQNFKRPYTAMAASAILTTGVRVLKWDGKLDEASIQSGLVRLRQELGDIDGEIGQKTKQALGNLGIEFTSVSDALIAVEKMLRDKFPEEYTTQAKDNIPVSLIPSPNT